LLGKDRQLALMFGERLDGTIIEEKLLTQQGRFQVLPNKKRFVNLIIKAGKSL